MNLKIKLCNPRLEAAWRYLSHYHESVIGNTEPDYVDVLDMGQLTTQIRSEDWSRYMDALTVVILIGRGRRRWLEFKNNHKHEPTFWCLKIEAVTPDAEKSQRH
jgi:hypothetical protein